MAQQTIDIGSAPNDGTGDPLRDAFDKANDNFTELYALVAVAGGQWKNPVRAATTAAITLATDAENGDTIDGVVLATGDRVLVKNQAAPEENGIYVVAASGAPARAADADSAAEMLNAAALVSEGTANADKLFVCTTNAPITLNTTGLTFTDFTPSGLTAAVAADVWTGTSTAVAVTPDSLFDAAAPQTLTDAATIAVDMATGINFNVTLGGNRTLGNPTNAKPGQSGRIRVTQDGTGSRTLAYDANWKHIGSAPTIATAAAAVDLFAYFVNDATNIELSYLGTLA